MAELGNDGKDHLVNQAEIDEKKYECSPNESLLINNFKACENIILLHDDDLMINEDYNFTLGNTNEIEDDKELKIDSSTIRDGKKLILKVHYYKTIDDERKFTSGSNKVYYNSDRVC